MYRTSKSFNYHWWKIVFKLYAFSSQTRGLGGINIKIHRDKMSIRDTGFWFWLIFKTPSLLIVSYFKHQWKFTGSMYIFCFYSFFVGLTYFQDSRKFSLIKHLIVYDPCKHKKFYRISATTRQWLITVVNLSWNM